MVIFRFVVVIAQAFNAWAWACMERRAWAGWLSIAAMADFRICRA